MWLYGILLEVKTLRSRDEKQKESKGIKSSNKCEFVKTDNVEFQVRNSLSKSELKSDKKDSIKLLKEEPWKGQSQICDQVSEVVSQRIHLSKDR